MNTINNQGDYRSLSILTISMIMGVVIFSIVSIVIHFTSGSFIADKATMNIFIIVDYILGFTLLLAARILYKHRVEILKELNLSSSEKRERFRNISITHLALCELSAFFSLICFILFGHFLFFLIVVIALYEMISRFPSREKVENIVNSSFYN